MTTKTSLPVYKLDKFRSQTGKSSLYQVEVFDANRHFEVQYPHRHDFYEVLFINRGTGLHIIDENQYEISPPCIFFLSPGQAHAIKTSLDVKGYIFLFNSEFYLLNQKNKTRLLEFPFFFSTERTNPPLILTELSDINFFEQLFIRACREVEPSRQTNHELLCSLLDTLLLSCNSLYHTTPHEMLRLKANILVKNFLVLLEENYHKNLQVHEYAQQLNITANHLTQVIKQITGKTSAELIHEKIIIESKRLLLHTSLSVNEICDILHFPDQSYFTKYFKKFTGQTPLQFRKDAAQRLEQGEI